MSEESKSGKQTPAEIEASRIQAVQQNAVVRVVMPREDMIQTAKFRSEPSAVKLTDKQFVADCLKHPERFAKGGPKRSQSRTWLHEVVFTQHLDAVSSLIKAGQEVNACDDLGRTALHYACAIGSKPIVDMLLKKGSFKDIELADKMGYRPLHLACEAGYQSIIKTLVKEGEADVNSQGPDGFRPLHLICQAGRDVACFTALLTVGEKLDLKDEDMYGRTPQDILKDVLGKNRGSNASQAIRKDKRKPWKLLNAAFGHEIKKRKDALYLKIQTMEEKEKQKQIALKRVNEGAKKQVARAMQLAREAFERGEKVDWEALGLDPDMEDELQALMAEEVDDDKSGDEEDEDEYGYEDEEESDSGEEDDEDGDGDGDGDDNGDGDGDDDDDEEEGGEPKFPQDYVGDAMDGRKMQMAAMASSATVDSDGEEEDGEEEENKEEDGEEEEEKKEEEEGKNASGSKEGEKKDTAESDVEQQKEQKKSANAANAAEKSGSEKNEEKPNLLEETYAAHLEEEEEEEEEEEVRSMPGASMDGSDKTTKLSEMTIEKSVIGDTDNDASAGAGSKEESKEGSKEESKEESKNDGRS